MSGFLTPVSVKGVRPISGLPRERQVINRDITVPYILNKCTETGRVSALKHLWNGSEETRPHPFRDSYIGKTVEAVAYALMDRPDADLEKQIDQIVDMLSVAQEEDGYLHSYYQTCESKENRWSFRVQAAIFIYCSTLIRNLISIS